MEALAWCHSLQQQLKCACCPQSFQAGFWQGSSAALCAPLPAVSPLLLLSLSFLSPAAASHSCPASEAAGALTAPVCGKAAALLTCSQVQPHLKAGCVQLWRGQPLPAVCAALAAPRRRALGPRGQAGQQAQAPHPAPPQTRPPQGVPLSAWQRCRNCKADRGCNAVLEQLMHPSCVVRLLLVSKAWSASKSTTSRTLTSSVTLLGAPGAAEWR